MNFQINKCICANGGKKSSALDPKYKPKIKSRFWRVQNV